jgi:O-methyltransferase
MMASKAAKTDGASLYIDLIKRALTDTIYSDDPLANFAPFRFRADRARWKNLAIGRLERLLRRRQMRIVEALGERDYPTRAHTMIGMRGLENLEYCIDAVMRENIPGDFIETGVWRGGACVFMRAMLAAHGDKSRVVWVADSFAGLPRPNPAEYPADKGDRHHKETRLNVTRSAVEKNFRSQSRAMVCGACPAVRAGQEPARQDSIRPTRAFVSAPGKPLG